MGGVGIKVSVFLMRYRCAFCYYNYGTLHCKTIPVPLTLCITLAFVGIAALINCIPDHANTFSNFHIHHFYNYHAHYL